MGYQEAGADSDALDGGMMKVKLLALESLNRLGLFSYHCPRKQVSDQFSTVPLYPSEADRYHSEEALGLLM